MKNDVVALAGSSPCAIETMPLTCFVSLNSGCSGRTIFCCFSVSGPRRAQDPVWTDEALHDAMERGAVEHAGGGEPQEGADVLRRFVAEELDGDRAGRSFEHRPVRAQRADVSVLNGSGSGGGVSRISTEAISIRSVVDAFGAGRRLGNLLHDIHAFRDPAEDGVLAVSDG